jgi:AraC-like DNA-binding protein
MILINETLPGPDEVVELYRRFPTEGMVQSSIMAGQRYGRSDAFDADWSCPAVTWSFGGDETYRLEDGSVVDLRVAGTMTIAAGERYSYVAGDTPFCSNMIVFPRWMTQAAHTRGVTLGTRLVRPDREMESLMAAIANRCRASVHDELWYREKVAQLFDRLAAEQVAIDSAPFAIDACKPLTRADLALRADRAQQFILRSYPDRELTIRAIAREACLSSFHLIRVFKALTGMTPMKYLQAARMTASRRLLCETPYSVTRIANSVGYSDRTAFARVFRRHFGVAPSSMRNQDGSSSRD